MDDKVLVRLRHGYYNGGITPLPDVCPTIDAHIDCWHILIGQKMKNTTILAVDGFNQSIRADQTCFGTLTRNAGADLKRNGQGVIEIVDEPLALDEQNGYVGQDGIVGTLTTDGSSPKHNNRVVDNYRIRKLTPKECGRLMGVKDDDIDKMSVNQSNSALYHCFGDALVTTVIGAIFCNMMDTPLSFDEMIKSLYNSPNR